MFTRAFASLLWPVSVPRCSLISNVIPKYSSKYFNTEKNIHKTLPLKKLCSDDNRSWILQEFVPLTAEKGSNDPNAGDKTVSGMGDF